MIPVPPAWSRHHLQDAIVMFPPDGHARGGIRYRERLGPIAPVSELLAKHIAEVPMLVESVGACERFTTAEGEHAIMATVRGTIDGAFVQRDIGFVILDQHYASIASIAMSGDDFASFTQLVRELLHGDVHLAGIRQRRFEYTPPAEWQARARGLHADWFAPAYPRERAVIHVFPALPSTRVCGASGLWTLLSDEDRPLGFRADDELVPIASTHGLQGIWAVYAHESRSVQRVFAALEDDRYVYAARLETTDDAHVSALHDLVQSIRPLGGISLPATSAAFSHWSD